MSEQTCTSAADQHKCAAADRIRPRTAIQLTILLFCVLFFQGCQKSTIRFTIGPFAPAVALEYNGDEPLKSEFDSFAPHWLILNLLLLGVLFCWRPTASRSAWLINRPECLMAVFLTAVLFNSVLYSMKLWQHSVFSPINHITETIQWCTRLPDQSAAGPFLVGLSSRIYFGMCVLMGIILSLLVKIVARRYVFTDPDRWWQFNLGSLLTITFVLGTGLGLLLRVLKP